MVDLDLVLSPDELLDDLGGDEVLEQLAADLRICGSSLCASAQQIREQSGVGEEHLWRQSLPGGEAGTPCRDRTNDEHRLQQAHVALDRLRAQAHALGDAVGDEDAAGLGSQDTNQAGHLGELLCVAHVA